MAHQKRKILLADDSKIYQEIFRSAFAEADYQLLICNSGAEAISIINENYVDFICSSFYLKDMEGTALCAKARALTNFAYKPFVLLTSVETENALKSALPAGVTDVFQKTEIDELLSYIKRFPFWNAKIHGRILYVEDNLSQRQVVKAMLEEHGLTVDGFSSVEDAWPNFTANDYDVVLTDIVLEGTVSGLNFVNRIRRYPGDKGDVPVLAMTAFDDKTRRIELFNLGVTDYITKPVVNEEMFVRVSSQITRKRLMDEARVRESKNQQAQLSSMYATLFRSNEAIIRIRDEIPLLEELCRIAVENGNDISMAWIGKLDETTRNIVPIARYGEGTDYLDNITISVRADIPEGHGPVGTAMREDTPSVINDYVNNPFMAPWHMAASHYGWRSCAAFPVHRNGRIYATLTVYHKQPYAFDAMTVGLLVEMSNDISLALDHIDQEHARVRTEQILAENENRLRSLGNNLPNGFVYQYQVSADGIPSFLYVSEGVERISGVTVDAVLQDANVLLGQIDPGQVESYRQAEAKSAVEMSDFAMELLLHGPDGRHTWMQLRSRPRRTGEGNVIWDGVSIDITERKQAEDQLKLSARVFAEAHEGISITDASGTVVDVNPMFSVITGYSREEIIGNNLRILKSNKHPPEFYAGIWTSLVEDGHWQGEVWNIKKNGTLYIELLSISALRNERGEILHYIGLFSDITKTKQQQQTLEMMAHYDALTQLPNRVLFADRFSQSIARAKRDKSLLAVCYLDLDGFKQVNDTLGHEAGDLLLIEVSGRIKGTLREEDTVSRLGGDEFGFLLGDMTTLEQCEQTLDRIHQAIAAPYQIMGQAVVIGASTGVTLYPQDDADPDTLLRHADQAMYQAKLQGRNQYFFFDSTQDQQVQQHRNQLHAIEDAFARREFCLHYQPKVNMHSGQIIGAEALIRWNHPERGILPPAEFLPVISGTHMENILGQWVMQEALNQLGNWHKAGINLQVSINISPRHLQSPGFYAELDAALAKHPEVNSRKLELEVLESSAVDNLTEISRVIDECFNLLGVPFALDDFGTGYSSLTYMRHLQTSTVKIDKSFVRDMVDDPDDFAIVEGVIGLSRAFRREVIAEGVESISHGLILISMGCALGQGYVIARPMAAEALPEWIKNWKPFTEWRELDPEKMGAEKVQFLILRMELDQWLTRMKECLEGENTTDDHWPVHGKNKCHLGRWIISARHGNNIDPDHLANLEQSHEELHRIASELRYKYQAGKSADARNGIKRLQATYQAVGTILKHLSSTV